MSRGTRRGRRNRPVFIERSGLRRKLLRQLAVTLGCACAGYLVFIGVVVGALRDPGTTSPPRIDAPLPTTNARYDSRLPGPSRPSDDTHPTEVPSTAPTAEPGGPKATPGTSREVRR